LIARHFGERTCLRARSLIGFLVSLLEGLRKNLAEREGFEPSVQVLARTTV
jgi:hypothetical protein